MRNIIILAKAKVEKEKLLEATTDITILAKVAQVSSFVDLV